MFWNPNSSSSDSSAPSSSSPSDSARAMRSDTTCNPRSSVSGPPAGSDAEALASSSGSGGIKKPSNGSSPSTSYTSAESNRNTPAIPVCDAITSMRSPISSKSGPSVSEWSNRTTIRHAWNVTGS